MKYTYFNRDLSWLRFNERVLQEAEDKNNPLYERIKFVAIYSSNLDEFFKVRVSDIRQIKTLDKALRKKLITKPNRLLKEIKKEVDRQGERLGKVLKNELFPELKKHNIEILNEQQYNVEQQKFVVNYFHSIKQEISFVDHLELENEKLYLVAQNEEKGLMIAKIPSNNRFIKLLSPQGHLYTYIDDILKYNLNQEYQTTFYALKISRDAELYIDDEYSGNLLEKIKDSLSNREVGQITRALIDASVDEHTLMALKNSLDINDTDLVMGGRYHNLKDFFGLPNPIGASLENEKQEALTPNYFKEEKTTFSLLEEKERILHFPYESYESIVQWIEEAAEDDEVDTIKITLYRVSSDSKIAKALVQAVQNGKQVFVFIETKARFDEENNIKWGKALESAGATVRYSYPGIKVHSKILFIQKKDSAFAYIGTGNFNEKTAGIYTDYGLLTANKKLTEEVNQVFRVLEGELIVPKIKNLIVSPFTSRDHFTRLLDKEIKKAKEGKNGNVFLKLNSIEDPKMIKQLYKASNAGVKIKLIVRGICCLVPGVKGQSENIEIVSIIDRYLEHARVYLFGEGEDEKMYIGSADWMTRNIDHRIEVITPVLDKENFEKVKKFMQIQWEDAVKGRIIDQTQGNQYLSNGNKEMGSQTRIYKYLKEMNLMVY